MPPEHSDAELLATVLGPASASACERLVTAYDGFRSAANVTAAELREHGFTTGPVQRLSAVFEIAKRYGEREWKVGAAFRGSADIHAHFRERLAAETREHFYAVLLDNKNRKLRDVLLSLGSLTASIVHPRDVFTQVVRHSAAAVVFVHNHPSGDATPSKEDIEITRRLREVGDVMGARVLETTSSSGKDGTSALWMMGIGERRSAQPWTLLERGVFGTTRRDDGSEICVGKALDAGGSGTLRVGVNIEEIPGIGRRAMPQDPESRRAIGEAAESGVRRIAEAM